VAEIGSVQEFLISKLVRVIYENIFWILHVFRDQ